MLELRAAYAIIPQIHSGKCRVSPEEVSDLGQTSFVNLFVGALYTPVLS